jgi:predicted ATPase
MPAGELRIDERDDAFMYPMDAFVGRQQDLRRLRRLVQRDTASPITVTGPAGVGKTRLALELAREAGAWFDGNLVIVRLAAVRDVAEIVPEIARALGIVDQAEQLELRVRDELTWQPHLLMLDNLEHLLPGAVAVIEWLQAECPGVRIVATSRRPLGIPAERAVEVLPFTTRIDLIDDAALEQDAVQLFIHRAAARAQRFRIRPGDAARISELCQRFDGLPLAIELLAGWADVLTPADMLQRGIRQLDRRASGDDPRHQSLLDAIAWSYDLLEVEEQALFRRLSIFLGGFGRDLVEKMVRGRESGAGYPWADGYDIVTKWYMGDVHGNSYKLNLSQNPDVALPLHPLDIEPVRGLATLLDHKLVTPGEEIDGVLCFGMLETIRDFGLMELERLDELDSVRHAHAATILAFGEASAAFVWSKSDRAWGRLRIDAALPNLRQALGWAAALGDDGAEILSRLSSYLWNYWQTRGLVTEGRQWMEMAFANPATPDWVRATELAGLGFLRWMQNDVPGAEASIYDAIEAAKRTGIQTSLGFSNMVLALIEYRREPIDVVKMLKFVDEAEHWSSLTGDVRGLGACNLIYGVVARLTGDHQQALKLFDAAREQMVESGYEWGIATARYFKAETVRELAETDKESIPEAIALLHESLCLYWEQGDFWGASGSMSGLACMLTHLDDRVQAATYFGAADRLMQRVGASLLPADLMTHDETAIALRARMESDLYDAAFQRGAGNPEEAVEQAIDTFDPASSGGRSPESIRLTNAQMAVVKELALGFDIVTVSKRRKREYTSTMEMAARICDRLGLDHWEEIGPFAIRNGLVPPPTPQAPRVLADWVNNSENM